ncbi:MAG TPA: ImmA/IrrE family metallo-endopeptidase [Chitinophaga sp.]|uniref:ImmA/IrrE family metallo-endopeptidase n=1 Tax=Chitinophaga sp. TaxID=1869181 RepID=UPI002BB848A1|nr:ImmA/IrrE family metallo-endopeptidase [Chitinophaga sp.]HVI49521.1 ImmA/IrrE family metallo-endopeptidase [Chitinophaga sp.]
MRISGIEYLSKEDIEARSRTLLSQFNPKCFQALQNIPMRKLCDYLTGAFGLSFNLKAALGYTADRSKILGTYCPVNKRVSIDMSIAWHEDRLNFTLAHEIGHWALHSKVKILNCSSNNFTDTEYGLTADRKKINTDADRMEWQANHFAACLLMPAGVVKEVLLKVLQKTSSLAKDGRIYLDELQYSVSDFKNIIKSLSDFFSVSPQAMEYRLNELDLII